MDTAEYETNALIINNISSIHYAFYEATFSSTIPFGAAALELEDALTNDGYLASVDRTRRGLWCFRLHRRDSQSEESGFSFANLLEKCGYTLSLVEHNVLEPLSLAKNRPPGLSASSTPSSSSPSGSALLEAKFRNAQTAISPGQASANVTGEQDPRTVNIQDTKPAASTSVEDVYQHFIAAILSAVFTTFASNTDAIPLNSRTLVLSPHVTDETNLTAPVLASIRVYLTTTGALVATVGVSLATGLVTFSDESSIPPLGMTVLAAPMGVFATCQAISDGDHCLVEGVTGQSPDSQIMRLRQGKDERSQSWRGLCARLLRMKNMSPPLSGTQRWLNLQRIRRKPIEQQFDGKRTPVVNTSLNMAWPSGLCFSKAFSNFMIGNGQSDIAMVASDKSYDPLSLAKTWFLGSGERDELLAKCSRERDAAAAAAREAASAENQTQQGNTLSPLALHRQAQPGAPAGAMYPTPPDGVQNPIGATPSMDGTVSSPGMNATVPAVVDLDTAVNDGWENQPAARDRGGTSFESENLFGDLGPDMFADNNITDADFNFFDEQPAEVDLGLDDLTVMPNANMSLDETMETDNQPLLEIKKETADAPSQAVASASVFVKPEIKHATGSVSEEAKQAATGGSHNQHTGGIKRPASPFNSRTVFKRIEASLNNYRAVQLNSQLDVNPWSTFDKVDFDPSLSAVNSKYQDHGRFDIPIEELQHDDAPSRDVTFTTTYSRRHRLDRTGLKELPLNMGFLPRKGASGSGNSSRHASPKKIQESFSDADSTSSVSDQDDSNSDRDETVSSTKQGSIRRRRGDDDGESLATSFKDAESNDAVSPRFPIDLSAFSTSEVDLPLKRYFADPQPVASQVSLSDHEYIMAAQILTEQVATTTLHLLAASRPSLQSSLDHRRDLMRVTHRSLRNLQVALHTYLGEVVECQFRPLVELQDVPLPGQPTRMQPRLPGSEHMKPNNLFQIPSPHLEMRRYDSRLSILPSAVTFWESLGLGPCNGTKDINAICIYPDSPGIKDDVGIFLDKMKSVYESLKLGSFSRLTASPDIPGGLISIEPDTAGNEDQGFASILEGTSLMGRISHLSDVLTHVAAKETNFVVYFICDTNMPSSLVESCYAFHQLFEKYKKQLTHSRKPADNEMVLQLIQLDFICSSTSVVAPSPHEFAQLARETYDRCTCFGGPMPSPSVVLEQPLPRMIDFKLSGTPSASLFHENSCLHLAYAQSVDERWVATAWTDNRGSQQVTASYCLGRKGKSLATPLADVAHEMWETTRELISVWKVHWRIIVTKCGVMDPSEVELWTHLAQTDSQLNASLTLLTVDTDPSLQLIPPAVKVPANVPGAFYTTPVSTPQTSIVSPEQSGNPPTPSLREPPTSAPTPGGTDATSESDSDATLIDVTDQTWGAVLAHRLSNSASPTELNPALASGYLVKRSGVRPDDPPIVMEVNVIQSEGNPRAYDVLLREMLFYFRGLGTLARIRGVVEKEVDVRPWHVAAAEKAARGLYLLM